MLEIIITNSAGETTPFDGKTGYSSMAILRDNGLDELLALCGGCCSCATCHVYIDPKFATDLPAMSDDENELLDSSSYRNKTSRLSCKVKMSEALSGLKVTITPAD